jgi:hypothetical protein
MIAAGNNNQETTLFFFLHKSDYFPRKLCVMSSTASSFLSAKFQGPPLRIYFLVYHSKLFWCLYFHVGEYFRPPTWQWEVDTGMAKSLEIPQTSTINAATHSTQNPLADRFSIYKHRPHCYLLNTEPRRGQFTITARYCPAILDRRHNLT